MKTVVSLLLSGLVLLIGVPAHRGLSAQQLPTFRTGVDAVQLDVSVLDKGRRPVRGLTEADFTVLENGKPRQIVSFSAIELPAPPAPSEAPAGAEAIQPDVTGNDLRDGRIVVIIIDPFLERVMMPGRVTIADPPGITALRATARRVVDSLAPGDLAAVGHTIYGVPQNFTTDRARLKRAIDTTAFGSNKRAAGEEWGNCNCGACRLEAITRAATALRAESQRRKAVFFIGERIQLAPVPGRCHAFLEQPTKEMLHATQLANVTVHTVDPNAMETTNVHAGDDFKPEPGISAQAAAQERANREFLIERHQSLQTVADWTGGRAILNTNAPEESVRPILEESSAYYLLAFEASDLKRDGRFHPITVKVNRPGVQVRTRRGFYAESVPPANTAPAGAVSLETVARGLLPARGLPMSLTAAPFRGPNGAPIILITTGVKASETTAPNEQHKTGAAASQLEPIEILASAFRDGQKDVDWQRQRMSSAIPDAPSGQLRYEAISRLNVTPGTYEVRVAVSHENAGKVGSVHAYVDVPDFDAQAVTLSGVVLLDQRAPTATPPEALAGILETAPTTRRDFTATDSVSALVRVYQRQPAPVTVSFRILDRAMREVAKTDTPLSSEQFTASGSVDVRFMLPFAKLQPGSYVLRVEKSGSDDAGSRDVRFTAK